MEEDEGEDEVSEEGGDHAEDEAFVFVGGGDGGIDAEGGHPRFGEEGGGIPDGAEEPEDDGGDEEGEMVHVMEVVEGHGHEASPMRGIGLLE